MWVAGVILALGLWSAWRPAETAPETAAMMTGAVLALLPWAWRRTPASALSGGAVGAAIILVCLALSACSGDDAAAGLRSAVLLAAVLTVAWLASREAPPGRCPALLALGLSLLALWAVWQVAVGFDRALAAVGDLPPAFQPNALERLMERRAFASLPLPGHLAVVLATAVPLLLAGLRRGRVRLVWGLGLALALVGLALARSPIGAALALGGAAALLLRRRAPPALVVLALLVLVVLAVAVVQRADVGKLEPVALRVDNWRTALRVWRSAPFAGVGLGGFGQAAQAVPLVIGNRPAHAHCLPLELLAELGPAGLVALGLGVVWLARLLLRLWPQHPELAVALAIVPLHNLVDFSLFVSGVALPWAVLLGWAVAMARPPAAPSAEAPGRALAVVAAAVALLLAGLHGTSVVVERAAAGAESPADRYAQAWTAWKLAPWRLPPAQLVAVSAVECGDRTRCREAADLLRRVVWLRRGSAVLAGLQARLAVANGAVLKGVSQAWLAERRRPWDPEPARYLAGLTAQLDGNGHAVP